jgi:hypothetical protein
MDLPPDDGKSVWPQIHFRYPSKSALMCDAFIASVRLFETCRAEDGVKKGLVQIPVTMINGEAFIGALTQSEFRSRDFSLQPEKPEV